MRTTNTVLRSPVFLLLCLTVSVFGIRDVAADAHLAAGRISDVINTKHNFAALYNPELPPNEQRTVKATTENQVCVFCHTPHGKPGTQIPFLWNHSMSGATYTSYDKLWSSSMQANVNPTLGNNSKMCLSCHDGTVALGTVGVFTDTSVTPSVTYPAVTTDVTPVTISMNGTNGGAIPDGAGATSGYTRNLGTDLRNDHPIAFTYSKTLADDDGELVDPTSTTYIGTRAGSGTVRNNTKLGNAGAPGNAIDTAATRFAVPLEPTLSGGYATTEGTVECTTCHDPHLRSTDYSINIKFLRLNRLQKATPGAGTFNKDSDINCLACHRKAGWENSVHAHPLVANEVYNNDAAALRELPQGTQVWEASCLNCHDAHTVEGARWLLRDGTGGTVGGSTTNGRFKIGDGSSALEETCYQCHSSNGVLLDLTSVSDMQTVQTTKISVHDVAPVTGEIHAVKDADSTEDVATLGKGQPPNRHVECTDCHHPHRMIRNEVFNPVDASTPDAKGTHRHSHQLGETNIHSNIASGVLRGAFGVEPEYTAATFSPYSNLPTFKVLKGDIDSTPAPTDYVSREYQVCLKCHSNYAQDINIAIPAVPDVAAEFQPLDYGATGANYVSWHPVVDSGGTAPGTGRTSAARVADKANWLPPFGPVDASDSFDPIGQQTMYCSDCHTNDDPTGPVGPHGSNQPSMLSGRWDTNTGTAAGTSSDLCFQCHRYEQYADPATAVAQTQSSDFSCAAPVCITVGDSGYFKNLHVYHAVQSGGSRCMDCHVARPHGAQNKALLVNLNDVGQTTAYTSAPYYNAAKAKIDTMQTAGNWDKASCGTVGGCH